MNCKKLVVFVSSIVLVFSITAIAYGQKKGAKAAKAAPKQAAPAQKAASTTPVGENENALDLNSAPVEKLMTLNGVDLMTARKIVAARPFKNKNEIVAKKIMSQEDLNRIARSVTVKGAEKTPPAKGKKS